MEKVVRAKVTIEDEVIKKLEFHFSSELPLKNQFHQVHSFCTALERHIVLELGLSIEAYIAWRMGE